MLANLIARCGSYIIGALFIATILLLPAGVAFGDALPKNADQKALNELNQLAAKSVSSNPVKALEYGGEAVKLSERLGDNKSKSEALLNMGLAHLQLGNLADVRNYLENSLSAAQEGDYLAGQGNAYNFLGTFYWEEGLYDQALKNYSKALEIRSKLNDIIGLSKTVNNLGLVYRQIGYFDKAIEYFQQSLDMKGGEDATGRTNTLTNMAVTLKEQRKYMQALHTLDQALEVGLNANYLQGRAFALRSKGEVLIDLGRLDEALEQLLKAGELYDKVNYRKGKAFTLYLSGRVFEEQGKFVQAMDKFQQGSLVAEKIGQKRLLGDIYYHSAKVAGITGDWQGALEYYEKSIRLAQEISMGEMKQRIILQQISLETERKQNEIDALKLLAERKALDAQNRENLLGVSLLSLVCIGVLAIYLRRQLLIKRKKEIELMAVTQNLEEARDQLNRLAVTDHLTGIANRRYFDGRYKDMFAVAATSEKPLTVIMADIDWFKQYNDLYGHQQGDECLKAVARELQKVMGSGTLTARYGGEEFVAVVQLGPKHGKELAEMAKTVIEKMDIAHKGSQFGKVTCSFGVATLEAVNGYSPEALLSNSDQALYLAKAQGRNRVVCNL